MRLFHSVDDLRGFVGSELGTSDWHLVDQVRIDRFAQVTEDEQWIHVDPERAADGPYGTTIAHGFLSVSLIPVMLNEIYQVEGAALRVNYGLNRVRFPAPVPSGARIRGTAVLLSLDDLESSVQVTLRTTVNREGGGKPVCVAENLTRIHL